MEYNMLLQKNKQTGEGFHLKNFNNYILNF
jgi:hypothetical protein